MTLFQTFSVFFNRMNFLGFGLKSATDENLVQSMLQGEEKAFNLLFERYGTGIYNYYLQRLGKKELAQELTQETFTRLWEKASKFDPERKFKVWFWTLARNRLNDYWREAYQEKDLEPEAEELNEDELEKLIQKEESQRIEQIFNSLPEVYRDILSLWLQDLSYEEIATISGKGLDAVKGSLKRAKQEFVKSWNKGNL